jgi:uncharacterized protein
MIMNRAEILEIIRKYKQENSEKYGIDAICLFGSYARDMSFEDSDVDIVIETREPDLYKMVYIKEDLKKRIEQDVEYVL